MVYFITKILSKNLTLYIVLWSTKLPFQRGITCVGKLFNFSCVGA